ncbi:class I SAM-dependent methyltransferase [Dactylosporangium sp. McL0621]|uniref:class I SAM-dependent methyltransferase n=1 Tax=Dactylosporangium sp. McL0621 TaxID=3415678 RepID=UPI003CFAB70B
MTAFWAQAAPGWVRHADRTDTVGRPLGAAAIERLGPAPGRVVDVGCGCGGTTAELAAVGVDVSPEMIAAARRRFPHLEFVCADVETLDEIPGAPFDAAYSRNALMLLADPVAGCTAIRRSLRPGAPLAAMVFRDMAANPWLPAALLGAAPHVGALPPLPVGDEPGPFAWADPARVRRILTAAGFDGIEVEPVDVVLEPPDEPGTVAEWLIELGPAGAAYRAAPAEARAAARDAAARLLARYRGPGPGHRLPAGLWLVTARA